MMPIPAAAAIHVSFGYRSHRRSASRLHWPTPSPDTILSSTGFGDSTRKAIHLAPLYESYRGKFTTGIRFVFRFELACMAILFSAFFSPLVGNCWDGRLFYEAIFGLSTIAPFLSP